MYFSRFGFLSFLSVLVFITSCAASAPPKMVPVPDVIGLFGNDGYSLLKDEGYTNVTLESIEDKRVMMKSQWLIIDQNPTEIAEGKTSTAITLTVTRPRDAYDIRALRLVRESDSNFSAEDAITAMVDDATICVESGTEYVVISFPSESISEPVSGTCAEYSPDESPQAQSEADDVTSPEEESTPHAAESSAYDGDEYARFVYEDWLASYGLGPDETFADMDLDEDVLLKHIVKLTSPADGTIIAILSMRAANVDPEEASQLANSQLNIVDSSVTKLIVESSDGEIVGTSGEIYERKATDSGLEGLYAQTACDLYAKRAFPYGVKMHWIVGKLAEDIRADEVFMKVEATVTNQYGAKLKGVNVECYVSGTNDNPKVTDFLYY